MTKRLKRKKIDEAANALSLVGTHLDEIWYLVRPKDRKEVRAIRLDCCGHAAALQRISLLLE